MNQTLHQTLAHYQRPMPPSQRDSYYSSTNDLRLGTTVSEVSLGQLPDDEVLEFLRMRHVWKRH